MVKNGYVNGSGAVIWTASRVDISSSETSSEKNKNKKKTKKKNTTKDVYRDATVV